MVYGCWFAAVGCCGRAPQAPRRRGAQLVQAEASPGAEVPPAAVSKGQVTIPQEIREQCGLLPHTQVRFVVENGRVLIEKESPTATRAQEGLQRLRRARPLRTRLSPMNCSL